MDHKSVWWHYFTRGSMNSGILYLIIGFISGYAILNAVDLEPPRAIPLIIVTCFIPIILGVFMLGFAERSCKEQSETIEEARVRYAVELDKIATALKHDVFEEAFLAGLSAYDAARTIFGDQVELEFQRSLETIAGEDGKYMNIYEDFTVFANKLFYSGKA